MNLRDVNYKKASLGNRKPLSLFSDTAVLFSLRFLYFILIGITLFFSNCQKASNNISATDNIQIQGFKLLVSNIVLYQNNENLPALNFNWNMAGNIFNCNYTIEAASYGTNFMQPIEIATTNSTSFSIAVKEANQKLSELVPPGQTDMVEFRLKVTNGVNPSIYSNTQALKVSIYENFIEYIQPQFMQVPGNYQNWDVTNAPHIVSRNNNGEFEGYINFINPGPQFLLLKDKNWIPINTYTDIGNGKFGFNGKVFAISSGSGFYLLRANTTTNNWNYFKINSWGINGTAINTSKNTDPEMIFDGTSGTWKITTQLQTGEFRIRANNSDTISFGKKITDGYIIPDYNGPSFKIDQPGNYSIVLNLHFAGNYFCSVIRKP